MSATSTIQAPAAPERAGLRQWLGLATLALPAMLIAIDVTVLYLAVPRLSVDLTPTSTQTLWIIDIYGFLIAGFLVTMGTLGDRIGRRKLLMIGAAAFGASALLAAYATGPGMLIAARAMMGVAGATLAPSTLALISNMFLNPAQRTLAVSVWVSSFSAGVAVGPLVGGVLLENFWWGSVFLINVPVTALLLMTAPFLLPEFRDRSAGTLDLRSVALSLAAILPIIYGIKELARGVDTVPVLILATGLLAATAFVRRQNQLDDPLVNMSLFRHRAFNGALAVILLGTVAMGGIYIFVTQYLQMVERLSPIAAGLWLVPPALALVVSNLVTPVVARRVRPAYVVAGGQVISVVGYLLLTQVTNTSGSGLLILGFLLAYVGFGTLLVLGIDLVVGSAPPDKAGSASALGASTTELGISVGIATLGTLGAAVYRNQVDGAFPDDLAPGATAAAEDSLAGAVGAADGLSSANASQLLGTATDAFADALSTVAGLAALVVAALALVSVALLNHLRPTGEAAQEIPPSSATSGPARRPVPLGR